MKLQKVVSVLLTGAMLFSLAGCGAPAGKAVEDLAVGNQEMGISVHDPSVVKADGKYYIFGSHMEAAVSEDLKSFKSIASGVNPPNPVFGEFLSGDKKAFDYVGKYIEGGYAVWAPDVIYNPVMEKWVMYFSTSYDYRTSNICMATADSIEGPYTYQETLIYSGYNLMNVEKTNFHQILGEDAKVTDYLSAGQYNNLNYPNCIDPTLFYDEEGKMWMVYGSWSGGIWLLEIDQTTGLPIHPQADEEKKIDTYYGYYLMGGLHNSCEGPYIVYDSSNGYYYMLVSYGGLTREGGYQIRQFRSENVTGPYVDAKGETFGYTGEHHQYGIKMMGNYDFPSLKTAVMAPGHCSAMIDEDGKYYLVHHQRFDGGTEYHEPRVRQMFMNEEGWLVAAPFATAGESLTEGGYASVEELAGTYYCVNHGTDISGEIHDAVEMTLGKDGSAKLADGASGTCSITAGTSYVTVTLGDVTYKGVIVEMTDEAGNPVRCIMASGNNNETIWAVHYKE